MPIIPPKPPGGKPPQPDTIEAILKKLPPDDPGWKILGQFLPAIGEACAQFEADGAPGVPLDPTRASDLALSLFSNCASAAIQTVGDLESAMACERGLADLINETMDWFFRWLLEFWPDNEENGKLCTKLNRQLLKLSRETTVTMWKSVREAQQVAPEPPAPASRNLDLLRDPGTGELRKYVSVKEAAAYCGVSERHMRRMMERGQIDYSGSKNNRHPLVADLIKLHPPVRPE